MALQSACSVQDDVAGALAIDIAEFRKVVEELTTQHKTSAVYCMAYNEAKRRLAKTKKQLGRSPKRLAGLLRPCLR